MAEESVRNLNRALNFVAESPNEIDDYWQNNDLTMNLESISQGLDLFVTSSVNDVLLTNTLCAILRKYSVSNTVTSIFLEVLNSLKRARYSFGFFFFLGFPASDATRPLN
jgi:hypothetical protein